ncbi:MAG: glycine dehydrogenase, partial [Thermodesulfobacteriota bacterium]|nr:glycine dehydrogenase [Thermodesulfobacteriota bacterium]
MRYLPHTDKEIAAMLQVAGARDLDDLFSGIPQDCRHAGDLDLPEPFTEWELNQHMAALSGQMATAPEYKIFLGAGSYEHYIPEVIKQLLARSEFYTAYTPYQPEISQGTLQAIYEYQTLTTRLLGMDVANASMY